MFIKTGITLSLVFGQSVYFVVSVITFEILNFSFFQFQFLILIPNNLAVVVTMSH